MRIREKDRHAIKETAQEVFGPADVYLFGSRVNDAERGGDIDLYIVPRRTIPASECLARKIRFITKLKQRIGDQKIDVVLAKDPRLPIEQEARSHGAKL